VLVGLAAEELPEAILLLPRSPRKAPRVALVAELLEHRLDCSQRIERRHPLRAPLQLTRGLRSAQEQDAQDRQLLLVQPQGLLGQVAVLDGTARVPAGQPRHPVARQPLRRFSHGVLVVGRHRIPIGRLVARQPQRVERERVLIGGREALLDQAPEHTLLGRRERLEVHAGSVIALRMLDAVPPHASGCG